MPPRKIRGRQGWYVDYWWEGKRTRLKSPVDSLQGARAFELELHEKMLKFGSAARLPDITFGAFSEIWMREYVEGRAKWSGLRTKRSILRAHLLPRFGHRRLCDIDAASIDQLTSELRQRGRKGKTVNNIVSVLSAALRQAVRRKYLREVPSIEYLQEDEPDFRFLEAEEAERLVAAATPGLWRTMILFALHTGVRVNELLAIEWSHLDFRRQLATVKQGEVDGHLDSTKTKRIRYVPLSDELLRSLETLPRTALRVFPMPAIQFPYHHALDNLKRISLEAGITPAITWHPLRHTFATLALAGGAPVTVVRDILGHSTIEMLNRYAHAARNMLRMATDALPRFTQELRHLSGTTALVRITDGIEDELTAPESALNQAKTADTVRG